VAAREHYHHQHQQHRPWLGRASGMRYGRERAARRTTEASSEAQMGRAMGEREERGVDGARDEREREERGASGACGARDGRERGASDAGWGARWEKAVAASGVRRDVRMG
jgi:hypothetical protein